jgi:hypothetical protein
MVPLAEVNDMSQPISIPFLCCLSVTLWISNKKTARRRSWQSAIPHRLDRLLVPIEIQSYVCAPLAAGRAGEAILDIGQPEIVRPRVRIHCDRMAA